MRARLLRTLKTTVPLLVIAALYVLLWELTGEGLPCFFYRITGFYCPGCGNGRLFIALLQLDFYQAFRYNPLTFVVLPFLLMLFLKYQIAYIRSKNLSFSKIERLLMIFFLVALILFGIMRNLPQLSFLAPTDV